MSSWTISRIRKRAKTPHWCRFTPAWAIHFREITYYFRTLEKAQRVRRAMVAHIESNGWPGKQTISDVVAAALVEL